jgi:lipoyl(octanoyl) transferase
MAERTERSEPVGRAARAVWLGRRPYGPMAELQLELASARAAGRVGDTVLLVEHEPVITLGRNAQASHVLGSSDALSSAGITLARATRGGDVTYHGPGQLVGYPIVDLKPDRCDVRRYVRALCAVMTRLADRFGVAAGTVDGLVGIWADAARPGSWAGRDQAKEMVKIGAVGVRLSDWISTHGFALNLGVRLEDYRWIVPCGIREHGVGSIASLTGQAPSVAETALGAVDVLRGALDLELESVEDLSAVADPGAVLLAV